MAATSFFLLIRRDAAEDGHFLRRLCKLRIRFERARVDELFRVGDARAAGDLGDGQGIVAGDDLGAHALLGEIREGLRRFGPDLVGQQDERERHHLRRERLVVQLPVVQGQQQHAAALGRPFLGLRQNRSFSGQAASRISGAPSRYVSSSWNDTPPYFFADRNGMAAMAVCMDWPVK